MRGKKVFIIAGIFGMLAVGLGAFGAHALKYSLTNMGLLSTYETAVAYHFYHTLALMLTGILSFKDATETQKHKIPQTGVDSSTTIRDIW